MTKDTKKKHRKKRHSKILLGLTCSAIFLWLAFRSIAPTELIESLKLLSGTDILAIIAIYLCGFVVRGLRCQSLLPQLSKLQAIKVVFIGYAFNNILPARMGEFARAHAAAKHTGLPYSTSLASVFVERVCDGSAVVCLLLLSSNFLSLPTWAHTLIFTASVLFLPALIVIILLPKLYPKLEISRRTFPAKELIERFIAGLSFMSRSTLMVAYIFFLSLVVWSIEAAMFYTGFTAMRLNLSPTTALFTMSVVNLAVLLPSSPGNIGIFQFAFVSCLGIFAVSEAIAGTLSIVLHAAQILPVTIIGLLFSIQYGLSLATVEEKTTAN